MKARTAGREGREGFAKNAKEQPKRVGCVWGAARTALTRWLISTVADDPACDPPTVIPATAGIQKRPPAYARTATGPYITRRDSPAIHPAVFRALCKHSKRAGITIQAAVRNAVFEKYSEEIDKENELIRKEQTL